MKAILIWGRQKLKMVEVPILQIKDDEILIKTLYTGICSTERELLEGGNINFPENEAFLIPGHEAVGRVVEVGKNITGFKTEDIVVPSVRRGCGECRFCNRNRMDLCNTGGYKERGIVNLHGYMSEYFIEQESNLTKIPEAIQSQAVLLEPLTVVIKALEEYFKIQERRLEIKSDVSGNEILKEALIIGTGTVGLLMALLMAQHDVRFTCLDIDREDGLKSSIVQKLGGQYIDIKDYLVESKSSLLDVCKKKNIGKVDLIVDASPDPLACFQLTELLNYNGAIVYLGIPDGEKESVLRLGHFVSNLVLKNGISIGSVNANPANFQTGIEHLIQTQTKYKGILDKMITHRFHYSDFRKAFNIKSAERIKVVLEWE